MFLKAYATLWLSAIALLTACTTAKKPTSQAVAMSAFTIVDGASNEVLRMDDGGKLYANQKQIGSLSASGEMKDPTGKLLATQQGDTLRGAIQKILTLIDRNGVISKGSRQTISWNPAGQLSAPGIALKLVPADTPARQAASALIYLYLSIAPAEQTGPR